MAAGDDVREQGTQPGDGKSSPPPPLGPRAAMSTIALGDVIAEGGMGVVRAAVQRSLARPVVIKTANARATSHEAQRMLLEAWVTGYLEHPGVVPVYDLVEGEGDLPIVVMRRIRGNTWQSCMRDAAWAEAQGARDLLEQNLRVLVRVCEVVEFAHDRHVVHRDIKPGNVMVGAFGEVYLLDWGLAVATGGEPAAHLPRADEARDPCGTLAYAAPEMLGLIDAPISPRTDVYLLGSVLFDVLVGRPPHRATDTRSTVESVDTTPPSVPPGIPPAVAAICARAMQRDPADRYATAAELRREVLAFLRLRDSEHLVGQAEDILGRLREACASDGPRRAAYDLYAECRFAFREALRTAPDHAAAKRGLLEAARVMIETELARDPRAASALLEEVADDLPDLAERVRTALASEEAKRAADARVARDHNPAIGGRGRKVVLVFFGLAWSVGQLGDHFAPINYKRFIVGSAVQLPIIAAFWIAMPSLRSTLFNRRMMGAVAVHVCSQLALFVCCAGLGVDVALARVLQVGQWAVIATLLAVVFERRFWPMAAAFVAAALVVFQAPHLRPIVTSLAILVLTLNVGMTRREASNEPQR